MNAHCHDVLFVYPGDLNTKTGGYIYDKTLIECLKNRGNRVDLLSLEGDYPIPDAAQRKLASDALNAIPKGKTLIIDGLALGVLPDEASQLSQYHQLIALVHHPLYLETGLSQDLKKFFYLSEKKALSHVHNILVTSDFTKQTLINEFGVNEKRITVALPGAAELPISQGSKHGFAILAVGSVTTRKAMHELIDAAAMVDGSHVTITIAGSLERDKTAVEKLYHAIEKTSLKGRITLTGETGQAELARLYNDADLFVSASHFEGYGMALMDAVAAGIPIVAAGGGAVRDVLKDKAAVLYDPGHIKELAQQISILSRRSGVYQDLKQKAIQARWDLPTWDQAAEAVEKLVASL